MEPRLRAARLSDAPAIAAFTSNTFSWGDYVADEFPSWVADEDVCAAVATDEHDRPVALARVRMLGPREGWLSSARVHPDHRRQGLASALNDWCVEWIRQQGGVVAHLQIETWNEAAQRQVTGLGYRQVATVVNGERAVTVDKIRPETNGGRRTRAEERLDSAPGAEADLAYIAWSTSELARAAKGMFPVERWAWRLMTETDPRDGTMWFCPAGWVMAEMDGTEMTVRWIVTTPDDASRLVKATTDLATEQGAETLHLIGPKVDWLTDAFDEYGFETHVTGIYSKPV